MAGPKVLEMPKRDDVAVKIAAPIYRKVKAIAAHRGVPIAEYLSSLLEKPVDRDYRKMHEEMGQEISGSEN